MAKIVLVLESDNKKEWVCKYRGKQCGAAMMVVTTNSCEGLWVINC